MQNLNRWNSVKNSGNKEKILKKECSKLWFKKIDIKVKKTYRKKKRIISLKEQLEV